MFKGFSQQLHERNGGDQLGGLEINPGIIGSFGSVVAVAEPLPETEFPLVHAEDDNEIMLDAWAKRPVPPPTILSIAIARLQALKPTSPERQKQVLETIATITTQSLGDVDALFAQLEQERTDAIDVRWEEIRKQGRALVESLPALEIELAAAMQACNASGEAKGQRKQDLETFFQARRKMSTFATTKEIATADQKVLQAREAMRLATDRALVDMRAMAVVEGKIATVQANLRTLKTEMLRLEAELRGTPYFDPQLGLSVDPLHHRVGA